MLNLIIPKHQQNKEILNIAVSLMDGGDDLPDGAGRRSNLRPQISSFLGDGAGNTRSLHFTLRIDDDTSVIYA